MDLRHDMLTHGVNIVTAGHEGRLAGLAVAWATQTATNRILICVGKQSATREVILAAGAFSLSVLRQDQLEIARRFGRTSSRDTDKFAGLAHHAAETGSPLLTTASPHSTAGSSPCTTSPAAASSSSAASSPPS